MYKKHKWFSDLRDYGAFNQLRQICDLTGLFNVLNLCQKANLAQCKLTGKSFEITYVSYTKRYHQFGTLYKHRLQSYRNIVYTF